MTLTFRSALRADLEQLVAMLADDALGQRRERAELPLAKAYIDAFEAIEADPNNRLIVAIRSAEADAVRNAAVVGMLQLTFLPNLTYMGSWRAMIEGVRVAGAVRGQGIGRRLIQEAIRQAREHGCRLVQLTTDKQRPEALRFYESLGFEPTHEGMKLSLESRGRSA